MTINVINTMILFMKTQAESNEYKREWLQKWREAHREQDRERCRRDYQKHLEVRREKNKRYYHQHSEQVKRRAEQRRWNVKLEVIRILGSVCKRCGLDDPRVLQVHHTNGGGSKERRQTEIKGGSFFTSIVKGEREISDLELLCCNCHAIHQYEHSQRYCPINKDQPIKGVKNAKVISDTSR